MQTRKIPGIREAAVPDIPVLNRIIRNAFRNMAEKYHLTAGCCPTHPAHSTEADVASGFEKGLRYFILSICGEDAGCVAMELASPGFCYLIRLAVLPQWRGHGFGTALVNHVIQTAREEGCRRIDAALIRDEKALQGWYAARQFVFREMKRTDHLPFDVVFVNCYPDTMVTGFNQKCGTQD